jgi:pilus assembly protein CpaE
VSDEALSLITIALDSNSASQLKGFVDSSHLVQLQGEFQHHFSEEDSSLLEWLSNPVPDICLIDFDDDRQGAALTAEKIHARFQHTVIFAISSNPQPDLIIQAMRCGCDEYLTKPLDRDQLLEAVARVGGRRRERQERVKGELHTFLGAKGGVGVTTLVTHLGALLAKSYSRKTVLVDFHPDLGDVGLYLGLHKHEYSFFNLVENTDRLDSELLQGFVTKHISGVDLLPAPDGTEPVSRVSSEDVGTTMNFLRLRYEFALVDCPPGLGEQNVELVRRSDWVHIVMLPEVPAVRNVVRYLDYLNRLEFPRDRVQIVLNRHSKKGGISDAQIEKAIHRTITWRIPNAYHEVVKTINSGDPVAHIRSSEVARTLMAWAGTLGSISSGGGDKKKENRGLLGLLGR